MIRPRRLPERDETEAWKAVAAESLRAFDAIFMPLSLTLQEGGEVALKHLRRGQALMQPILDRYISDARTPVGRAWRRRAIARSNYVRAFEEAIAHAEAHAAAPPGRTSCPAPDDWPSLWTRDGRLWLIQRHTGDRRVLREMEEEQP